MLTYSCIECRGWEVHRHGVERRCACSESKGCRLVVRWGVQGVTRVQVIIATSNTLLIPLLCLKLLLCSFSLHSFLNPSYIVAGKKNRQLFLLHCNGKKKLGELKLKHAVL